MRNILIVATALSILWMPFSVYAAVAYDTSAQIASTLTSSPQSVTMTIGASNEWLVCDVAFPSGKTVSAFTYNGVSLTQIFTKTNSASQRFYLYTLYNPSTGSHSLTITPSGTENQNVNCAAYSGGRSSLDSTNMSTYIGGVTTKTASTTVVASGSWFIGMANGNRANTTASGQTTRLTGGNNINFDLADSNGPVSTGLNSMSWTSTAEPAGGTPMFGISIAPLSSSPVTVLPFPITWW